MKRILLLVFVLSLVPATLVAGSSSRCAAEPPETLVSALLGQAPGLRAKVLRLAMDAAACAAERGMVRRRNLLTVIDYSLPSSQPRLFVFDVSSRKLLFRELVAHGKNSGGDQTTSFSNTHGSLATSIGLFVTADPYFGGNGYSLRLKGLEEGFNDQAWDRLVVMHGASYVSRAAIKALGRLGRSWGCPAVRKEVARDIINTLRGGSPVFAYYPDHDWLRSSKFLRGAA